jgi:hypothetical protein
MTGRKRKRKSYRSCSIKRARRTKAEMDDIKAALKRIVKAGRPSMTVRQIFYQCVVQGVIPKTEESYANVVIRLLTEMRMSDEINFEDIADETRQRSTTRTYNSIADAARDTAQFYRRNALRECSDNIEVWVEKEALAGLIESVADEYDVPVIVSRGMPSLTQLYWSAYHIKLAANANKYTYIYQFGDHDPSGVLIPGVIERRLTQLCEKFDCPRPILERVALTEEQIEDFDLPTRPTKRNGNPHAASFEGESVELDALPPDELRQLVRESIEQHISERQLEVLRAAEESERELLEAWADRIEENAA